MLHFSKYLTLYNCRRKELVMFEILINNHSYVWNYLWCLRRVTVNVDLKVHLHKTLTSGFFKYQKNLLSPLFQTLNLFQIWSSFCQNILILTHSAYPQYAPNFVSTRNASVHICGINRMKHCKFVKYTEWNSTLFHNTQKLRKRC